MAVVFPMLLMLTFVLMELSALYSFKNMVNHATFMAARAGGTANTNRATMRDALIKNLVPAFGGGLNDTELAASQTKATEAIDTAETLLRRNAIQIMNPTALAYDDWADENVRVPGFAGRTIPNSGLEYRPVEAGRASQLTIQDANILKIKVTVPYKVAFPYVLAALHRVLWEQWKDDSSVSGTDYYALVTHGYVPVVSYATIQMHSDPVEN